MGIEGRVRSVFPRSKLKILTLPKGKKMACSHRWATPSDARGGVALAVRGGHARMTGTRPAQASQNGTKVYLTLHTLLLANPSAYAFVL